MGLSARILIPPDIPCQMFPSDNIWNTPIDNLPVHVNSDTYINTVGAAKPLHPDFGAGLYNGAPTGIPYMVVPGSQKKVKVTFDYPDESDGIMYPVPPNPLIEGGDSSQGDRHILMVDKDNCILYELYYAFPNSDGTWRAGSGAIFDLNSDTLRPDGWTSCDAAGLPILPGLVRYEEVANGEINHAIRFTVPKTQRAYMWPARHYASSITDKSYMPMVLRMRLKKDYDISSFSAENQVILKAYKKYGMILADNGSAWFFTGVGDDRWNNDDLNNLKKLKGSDFEAVDESSLMIDPNSGRAKQSAGVAINAPAGTEEICSGSEFEIKWSPVGLDTNTKFSIDYKRNIETAWKSIAKDVTGLKYKWFIMSDVPSAKDYKIRISYNSSADNVISNTFAILEQVSGGGTKTIPSTWDVCDNTDMTITVSAHGDNIRYQWYSGTTPIPNETDSVLKFRASTTYCGNFQCGIWGACQSHISSSLLNITIKPSTHVNSIARDTTINKGKDISLIVNAIGRNLNFIWQKDGTIIPGAIDSIYTMSNLKIANSGLYQCIVSGDCGADSSFKMKLSVDSVTSVYPFTENELSEFSMLVTGNNSNDNSIDLSIISKQNCDLTILLFDNSGRNTGKLFSGNLNEGINKLNLNTGNLSSGIYWLAGICDGKTAYRKYQVVR